MQDPSYHITLDFPVRPRARYGYGKPSHPQIERIFAAARPRIAERLREVLAVREDLVRIPRDPDPGDPAAPAWVNGFLSGLDSALLYSLVRARAPRRYVEIGSGHSTRFARRAIRDGGLATRVVSIDPEPRAEVEALCDASIRRPLEEVELERFDELEAGDLLFLDGSHRVFTNSDAVVFFLEILPRLRPGVLVHVHDIFLPNDYPPEWSDRFYSEQYLLACWLLADSPRLEVLLPAAWVSGQPDLLGILDPLWADPRMAGVQHDGCSFWLEKR
jgi:predicted O-methyltransferase YrrM